jgi:hypothetical protein
LIPRFEREGPSIGVVADRVSVQVDAGSVSRGILGAEGGYSAAWFVEAKWSVAADYLDREAEALAELDLGTDDRQAFEDAAWDMEGELFHGLELGVCPAVEALCAAGCPTFSSCRGHGGSAFHRVRRRRMPRHALD